MSLGSCGPVPHEKQLRDRPLELAAGDSGGESGYGFFSASSDGRPSTMADHEEAIRNFLHRQTRYGYVE
jgi:hypothetical protein